MRVSRWLPGGNLFSDRTSNAADGNGDHKAENAVTDLDAEVPHMKTSDENDRCTLFSGSHPRRQHLAAPGQVGLRQRDLAGAGIAQGERGGRGELPRDPPASGRQRGGHGEDAARAGAVDRDRFGEGAVHQQPRRQRDADARVPQAVRDVGGEWA
jgi:hypothetical protein